MVRLVTGKVEGHQKLYYREVLKRGETGGCNLADIALLGGVSSCFECPFPDCISNQKSTVFIDKMSEVFLFIKPEVAAALLGVSKRSIYRRLSCLNNNLMKQNLEGQELETN